MLPDTSLDLFHEHVTRVNNSNTAGKYRLGASKFVAFCAGQHLRFETLPPGVLTLFSEVLISQRLAPSSVSVMVAGAKRYLKWLQDRGALPTTHFSSPDLPRVTKADPNTLRDDDLRAFFVLAGQCPEPARTAILLLPYCGLRSNELTNLTLRSMRTVKVPQKDGGTVGHVCFTVKGKGGDFRTVPLLLDGRPILTQYLEEWRAFRFGEYLFPATEMDPISNRTIRWYVQWIREQMAANGRNPSRLTPHTLRRTYVTTLWRAGIDMPTIAKIAGHKNVQTTVSHYLEVTPEDLASEVQNRHVSLIAKGPYADSVRTAQGNVTKFLDSLKTEEDEEDDG